MSKIRAKEKLILYGVLVASGALNLVQYSGEAKSQAAPANAPQARQRVVDQFHRMYYESADTWATSRWLGVLTQQNPNDAWVHQEIIWEIKPDFIVEAGTLNGGSAALWAMVLEQANPEGKVITIDIEDQVREAKRLPIVRKKVEFLIGSSTDPKIVDEVARRVKGRKVLVILDSDHSKEHVLRELQAYSPLVSAGSYIIVQDTNVNGHPVFKDFGPGPMEAVDEFLAQNNRFAPDPARERLLFTMHPKGYLKRVR